MKLKQVLFMLEQRNLDVVRKIEEIEKNSSSWKLNPGHLLQLVLCHWATTTGQSPALTIQCTAQVVLSANVVLQACPTSHDLHRERKGLSFHYSRKLL